MLEGDERAGSLPTVFRLLSSLLGFLRNWAVGKRPPETGAHDKQINCCVRLPPLLAMFQGHPDLLPIVSVAEAENRRRERGGNERKDRERETM